MAGKILISFLTAAFIAFPLLAPAQGRIGGGYGPGMMGGYYNYRGKAVEKSEAVKAELKAIVSDSNYTLKLPNPASESEVDFVVQSALERANDLLFKTNEAKARWCEGQAMMSLFGRVEGRVVQDKIRKILDL